MVPRHAKPVIGLIGAIGAGKSTAAAAFGRRGGYVVDCDRLGHFALDRPDVRERLVGRWGEQILSENTVNRRVVGGIVFADAKERTALQEIVFHVIAEMAHAEMTHADADPATRFIVLDAAMLIEAGWNDICDHVVYIDAPRELRLSRVASRSGWTADDLQARESAQWPAEKKQSFADTRIINDNSTDRLQQEVDRTLRKWDLLPEAVS